MMKHLYWYPWIVGALVLGILVCLGMIIHLLLQPVPQPAIYQNAQMVLEVVRHASL